MILTLSTVDFLKWCFSQPLVKKLFRFSVLWIVLVACTANICNSFFIKWGFRDDSAYASMDKIIAGSAHQPYVYRGVIPRLVDQAVSRIPAKKQEQLYQKIIVSDELRHHFFHKLPAHLWTPQLALDYHLLYGLILLSTLLILIYLRKLFLVFYTDFSASLFAVILFSLMYPLTFKRGGYYYDFFELLGLTVSTYYFLTQHKLIGSLLLILTAFNKETAFVSALGLFFLHSKETSIQSRLAFLTLQIGVCLWVRHWIMAPYTGNTDAALHFHLLDNAKFWLNPLSYLKLSDFYTLGLFSPTIQHLLVLPWLSFWIWSGWQSLERMYQRYVLGIVIPNLVLFLTFSTKDEFRNFSLSFIALYIVLIHGFAKFRQWLDTTPPQPT